MGPDSQKFTAHRDFLVKSPKFKVQCNSEHFPESESKRIELLDHDPTIFALLLEYLYKDDYWPKKGEELSIYRFVNNEESRIIQTQREADLYCMAGYCQLWGLQKLVVAKIKLLAPLRMESFLSISKHIYDNNSGPGAFRQYFREQIQLYLVEEAGVEPWVMTQIAEGGDLATDLFLASRDIGGTPSGTWGWPKKKAKGKKPGLSLSGEDNPPDMETFAKTLQISSRYSIQELMKDAAVAR